MKLIQRKESRKAMSNIDEKLRSIWYMTGEKMHLYLLSCVLTSILLFLCCHVVIEDKQQLFGKTLPANVNVGVIPSQHHDASLAARFQGRPQVDGDGRCSGRRIYMYTLPSRYNTDLLRNCEFGVVKWLNFCPHAANDGFGQSHDNVPAEMSIGEGWYSTDAYMLEVIFHSRMRQYSCLTNDTSVADAFFVPYYTGLDALYYLYPEGNLTQRLSSGNRSKQHGKDLIAWLEENAGDLWQRHGGKDHFMVMGRTSWDFIKIGAAGGGWGTGISYLPHISNMSTLLIEKRPWVENEQAVPYPTAFHPTSQQLQNWISKIKTSKRTYLLAYAGGIRPTMQDTSFRNQLLNQCLKSSSCVTVDCGKLKCSHNPKPITDAFLQSNFCLQPRGDTPTRRSAFDAMIAGCIPVFFHEDSAYTQYTWHLPEDPRNYSVYISEEDIKEGTQVEELLRLYSKDKIAQLRDSISQLIPRLLYSSQQFGSESGENSNPDAFDISILGILKSIRKLKARNSSEQTLGRMNSSLHYDRIQNM